MSALPEGEVSYDPSGDTRLDGDDILEMIATHLSVHRRDLESALRLLVAEKTKHGHHFDLPGGLK